MSRVCCVKQCAHSAGGADDTGVTYFPMPVAPSLRRQWVAALPQDAEVTLYSMICSKHFKPNQYETVRGKVRLKGRVVPTVFGDQDGNQEPSLEPAQSKSKQNGRRRRTRRRRKSISSTSSSNDDDDDSENDSDGGDDDHRDGSDQEWAPKTAKQAAKRKAGNGQVSDNGVDSQLVVTPDLAQLMGLAAGAGDSIECEPELPPLSPAPEWMGSDPEPAQQHTDDIEDIIANYHIKQDKELAERLMEAQMVERDRLEKEKRERERQEKERVQKERQDIENKRKLQNSMSTPPQPPPNSRHPKRARGSDVISDDDVLEVTSPHTNFVEIAVGGGRGESARDDCLLVMESVEVLLDPTALIHHSDTTGYRHTSVGGTGNGDNDVEISLLTSSDEDDVILQEPHVDTVEVSDETDEDDVPLVQIAKQPRGKETDGGFSTDILWSKRRERYCYVCHWVTTSKAEMDRHRRLHDTDNNLHSLHTVDLPPAPQKVIRVCEVCHFSTASEAQFNRHRKKHKDEKRFKCGQCEYRAKHRMSLTYHMRAHQHSATDSLSPFAAALAPATDKYCCNGCQLSTSDEAEMLRHSRICRRLRATTRRCSRCPYYSRRASDLRRHVKRVHSKQDEYDDDDDEEYVPR